MFPFPLPLSKDSWKGFLGLSVKVRDVICYQKCCWVVFFVVIFFGGGVVVGFFCYWGPQSNSLGNVKPGLGGQTTAC